MMNNRLKNLSRRGGADRIETGLNPLTSDLALHLGTTYVALKETSRTSFCGLQPSAGLCLALSERFYYDVNAGHCKKFVYGGCGGNQNRFTSREQCDSRCSLTK
ncbi:unnamed protein product [Arctia plantaginis]|uniref:BPTI/Kunitz inhibitor domain-containing protein n=1 Tax=Arctia plantaginis TaxID=874455 RepID=A0A8S1B3N1_ARCPL|nr:unnamed protein product [Arctia plantaginis]